MRQKFPAPSGTIWTRARTQDGRWWMSSLLFETGAARKRAAATPHPDEESGQPAVSVYVNFAAVDLADPVPPASPKPVCSHTFYVEGQVTAGAKNVHGRPNGFAALALQNADRNDGEWISRDLDRPVKLLSVHPSSSAGALGKAQETTGGTETPRWAAQGDSKTGGAKAPRQTKKHGKATSNGAAGQPPDKGQRPAEGDPA
ncbi:hypothetical protein KC342_g18904 [Hortaea werneckii]|nr:hypothetical protein KC342_g18904 [Hortaea werneckii]